jgi:hypothetical protein
MQKAAIFLAEIEDEELRLGKASHPGQFISLEHLIMDVSGPEDVLTIDPAPQARATGSDYREIETEGEERKKKRRMSEEEKWPELPSVKKEPYHREVFNPTGTSSGAIAGAVEGVAAVRITGLRPPQRVSAVYTIKEELPRAPQPQHQAYFPQTPPEDLPLIARVIRQVPASQVITNEDELEMESECSTRLGSPAGAEAIAEQCRSS